MWVLEAKPQSSAKVASALYYASSLQPLEPALFMDRLSHLQLWNSPFSLPKPCCPRGKWFHIGRFFFYIYFMLNLFLYLKLLFLHFLLECLLLLPNPLFLSFCLFIFSDVCSFSVMIISMWQGELMYRLMHSWALQVQRHVFGWVCSCWLEYDQRLENLHSTF